MSDTAATPPPVLPEAVPSPEKVLRRLFLTLFLRGRGARGLNKSGAPKSVFDKLALALIFYALFGCVGLFLLREPVFALAAYMHAMTFVFLGMFVAASSGEILFNKEEGDILLHRPVTPAVMLWAKVRVLVEVSLWLAGAFNLAVLIGGFVHGYNWRFPLVHIFSTTLEALFCTGSVILVYQLCLRWFGRERLEGLMTTAQVVISVAAVAAGQIVPRLIFRVGHTLDVSESSWWIALLPPAWFAGLDDALAGSSQLASWLLSALALAVTGVVLWLAFGKLAGDYQTGLQTLSETVSRPRRTAGKSRWLDRLVTVPPLSWWLRDSVSRASFVLTAAYLFRDRDVKLRVYPGIAPMLVVPIIFVFQGHERHGSGELSFMIPFAGAFLGLVPLSGLQLLQYSQQWQAADVFRAAPMRGPGPICHGARRAVLCFLALPVLLFMGLVVWALRGDSSVLLLFLPGLVALPVFALIPHLGGEGVPLSMPTEEAKAAGRGLNMIGVMVVAGVVAWVAGWSMQNGYFWQFMIGEGLVAGVFYFIFRSRLDKARWPSME